MTGLWWALWGAQVVLGIAATAFGVRALLRTRPRPKARPPNYFGARATPDELTPTVPEDGGCYDGSNEP